MASMDLFVKRRKTARKSFMRMYSTTAWFKNWASVMQMKRM